MHIATSWTRRVVGVALALAAVAVSDRAPAADEPAPLVVFAAASLKDALDAIAADWHAAGHARVVASYAASAAIAQQVAAGAPADVVVSADTDWMDHLAKRSLVRDDTRIDVTGNALVIVAPSASTIVLSPAPGFPLLAALGVDGRLAMADPATVPAGKYGRAAMATFGVWDEVASRVAPAENVRAALLLVARGEAPLGIVYASDAHVEPAVRVVATFPASSHPRIVYPAAVTRASTHAEAAAFVAYLATAPAQARLRDAGFAPLDAAR